MERIFHDVSLRAMYRKPLTSRARDAAHELGTVRKCFVQALKCLANVLFRLSSVSPAHHTPLGPAVVAGPRAAHYGHSCVSLRSMSLSSHAKTPSSVCFRLIPVLQSVYEAPYSMGSNFDKSVGGHVHALREYNSRSLLNGSCEPPGVCVNRSQVYLT